MNFYIKKSIHYYSLAANQNYPQALLNLGLIYKEGEYIECDIDKAIECYTKAVELNYPEAQSNLFNIFSRKKYNRLNIDKSLEPLFKWI